MRPTGAGPATSGRCRFWALEVIGSHQLCRARHGGLQAPQQKIGEGLVLGGRVIGADLGRRRDQSLQKNTRTNQSSPYLAKQPTGARNTGRAATPVSRSGKSSGVQAIASRTILRGTISRPKRPLPSSQYAGLISWANQLKRKTNADKRSIARCGGFPLSWFGGLVFGRECSKPGFLEIGSENALGGGLSR
ncbi:hypothetical protein Thiosp_04193 [Thiorhodovibrio litoralis]|nr:hypothetical protein Thiosp_04193 [Thiorhodovibrio litoralis]